MRRGGYCTGWLILVLLAGVCHGQLLPVPGGVYALGAGDAKGGLVPATDSLATLAGFQLGRGEVSNGEFCAFLNAGNSAYYDRRMEILLFDGRYQVIGGSAKHPVHHASWKAAKAYAAWSGHRLPTAAEFEAAARGRATEEGGTTRWYPWGAEPSGGHKANCQETQRLGVLYSWPADTLVGAGPFGHGNLAGNLAEWTADVDRDTTWALVKGGSWADPEALLKSPIGVRRPTGEGSSLIGFRVAR